MSLLNFGLKDASVGFTHNIVLRQIDRKTRSLAQHEAQKCQYWFGLALHGR